ncbi:hypothetical protein RQP53_14085 [Paucibacter sp. APW11]|uniref:Glutathionylspermidine synthase pre-ATP-grasp-like domain-containing protein n=1 Tax=Roseateles aquae TaxID=3077235 RepID=A0ABU3PCU8_9BURK|nr:hypothetical protein [Paucibacter sp. APW11]MDT9000400.1 hypothetical protein [Paucibacter sp. APW11]
MLRSRDYAALASDAQLVLQALEQLNRLYCDEPDIQARFPELRHLRPYISHATSGQRDIPLARFDLMRGADGRWQMLESNSDCPGGLTLTGIVNRAFRASDFYDRHLVERVQAVENADGFLQLMRERSPRQPARLAFLWSEFQPLRNDIQTLHDRALSLGGPAPYIGPVQSLVFREDQVLADGRPIDLAFTKIDTTLGADGLIHWCAWRHDPEEARPLLEAMASGQLRTLSPLPAMMVAENKRALALLFEDDVRRTLSAAQCAAIDRLVAPSSCLGPACKAPRWTAAELLAVPHRFVLKTAIDTRGRGVFVGRDCKPAQWQLLVEQALAGRLLVQALIDAKPEAVTIDLEQRPPMHNVLSLFLYGGKPVGLLGRCARQSIVNVGHGGLLRPALVVDELPSYVEH